MVEMSKPIVSFKEKFFMPTPYSHLLACLILLYLYASVFSCLLPAGINQIFMYWLIGLLPIPTALLFCVVIYLRHREQKDIKITDRQPAFDIKDLPLLLLPMTPIARYILLNMDVLTVFQGVLVFLMFLFLAFVLSFVIPAAFRVTGSKTFLTMTGLSFSLVIFNMAALASDYSWNRAGRIGIQLSVLLLAALIPAIIYFKSREFLNIAVIIFFVTGVIFTGGTATEVPAALEESDLYEMVTGREPAYRPDIFLLVYESYVENETMLQYGIDNSGQEEFLINNGFHIYRGNWTVGADTLTSMDSILNVSKSAGTRTGTSGNGAVQNILEGAGYKTYGIFRSDYLTRGADTFYDYTFPMPAGMSLLLPRQILEGQFRFDAGFDEVYYPDYLSEKRSILAESSNSPIFLYTHNRYPDHSQNSGKALGNEVELYKEGLAKANEEMREDIRITEKYNPDAIIIVCGDHGPYLTKNCTLTGRNDRYHISEITRLDIQDRYGSFLAIRWPEEADVNHEDIDILQDIFPVIFAWMYDDPAILKTRIEQISIGANKVTSGALVRNGIIKGGVDDGKPLFKSTKEK
jgi:hypothetical protein